MQCIKRTYANEITNLDPMYRPSTSDQKKETTIPGHPSETSSILDQTSLPPTRRSREAAERLSDLSRESSSIQASLNAYLAASEQLNPTGPGNLVSQEPNAGLQKNSKRLDDFYHSRRQQRTISNLGSNLVNVYNPTDIIRNPPKPDDITLPMLLANQTHLGHATSLWNPSNSSYIFGIREGIHIISLDITLAYLRRAAKVVREVARRGGIILFVGTRKGQQEIIVNAAKLADGYHIFDRWVAGTLTNGQQILGDCAIKVVNSMDKEIEGYRDVLRESNHPAMRPDLVVCLNPLENEVCLHECGLYTVPTIGVIDTDANPSWVTYPIPANDDSLRSIALIAGALGRAGQEGQEMRKAAAEMGETTYDPSRVQKMLDGLAELASIDRGVQGSKDVDKDT